MRNRKIRKVFIDVGGLDGSTTYDFILKHKDNSNDFEYYIIECSPINLGYLKKRLGKFKRFRRNLVVNIIEKAAWIFDGEVDLYTGNAKRNTLLKEYHKGGRDNLDKEHPIKVPCFDFGQWLAKTFTKEDKIYIHMNIEGAEYDILDKMIKDGTIHLVTEMIFAPHTRQVRQKSAEKEKIIFDYLKDNKLENIYRWTAKNRERFMRV